jgi:predicted phosphodiesterase
MLFFELSQPAAGTITLYPQDDISPSRTIQLDAAQQRHLILIEDLQPATTYAVIVALEENGQLTQPAFQSRAWAPLELTTRSAPSEPIRVGVIGDASFGDEATTALIERMAQADLDFVLNLGDVVDETTFGVDPFESYAENYYTPFEPLLRQMPVYTVAGNHDYDFDLRYQEQPFYAYAFPPFTSDDPLTADGSFAGQFAALPVGDLQFLLLDTMAIIGQPGREAQQTWLEARLADPNYAASIPVFHVSPFSSSVVHPEDSSFARIVWVPLFEQSATVPLVLSGHFHHFERLKINDITYVVSGGGSSILYAPGPYLPESQFFARQTHFVLLEINPDSITLSAISLEGNVFDTDVIFLPKKP